MAMEDLADAGNVRELREDVQNLAGDVRQLKDDLARLVQHASDAAKTGVRAAGESMSDSMDDLREHGEEAAESLREQIAARPLASLGIAAGVGFLVGVTLARARS